MWHEARKQEKFIRNVMVDVKKRAERRKDFYDKIRQDPIRFLRLYGSKSKLNIDPEISVAAENPNTLMTWVGDNQTVIDRFDVRANLATVDNKINYNPSGEEKLQERMCNYERYRCLVHNQFARVSESLALNKIEITEKYGEDLHKMEKQSQKKKSTTDKAAIGYVYSDSDYIHHPDNSDSDSLDSEPDLDMDLDIELDIGRLSFMQQKELIKISHQFGMRGNDYLKLMKVDKTQEEEFRTAKLLEEQKAQFHGRKSRRERKIFKEQRLKEKYMKQDPKTLTFGASVFHEEIFVGMNLLTPSPEREIEEKRCESPENRKATNTESIPSSVLKFTNLPTIRDDSRSRSRSRHRRRESSTSSSTSSRSNHRKRVKQGASYHISSKRRRSSGSRKRSYQRRSRSKSREKRRRGDSGAKSHSRDRFYNSRNKQKYKSSREKDNYHGYDLSNQRTSETNKSGEKSIPEIPLEELLKKKYYQSESESSSTFDGSSSDNEEESTNGNKKFGNCNSQQYFSHQKTTVYQHHSQQKKDSTNHSTTSNTIVSNKVDKIASRFNPQEFLKRQMEIQLNRAYREDKKAEQEKQQKIEKERMDRENQLREMAVQIRKREKEKRYQNDRYDDDDEPGGNRSSVSSSSSELMRRQKKRFSNSSTSSLTAGKLSLLPSSSFSSSRKSGQSLRTRSPAHTRRNSRSPRYYSGSRYHRR